jgi:hypothetical protein
MRTREEQHDAFLETLVQRCESPKAVSSDFKVVLDYMKAIGLVAEIAAEVAQDPSGARAGKIRGVRGIVGRLPFDPDSVDQEDEDPEALVG